MSPAQIQRRQTLGLTTVSSHALQAQGTIVTLETVVENGKTTYEGQVKTKTRKNVTMELDANGKALKK